MKKNFEKFQQDFYKAVDESNNLIPFNRYVHTIMVTEEDKDHLAVDFAFTDSTGYERRDGFIAPRTDDAERLAAGMSAWLSINGYSNFVLWKLDDAIKSGIDFYKERAKAELDDPERWVDLINDQPERWWNGIIESGDDRDDKFLKVGFRSFLKEILVFIRCDKDNYVEWFNVNDKTITETVTEELYGEDSEEEPKVKRFGSVMVGWNVIAQAIAEELASSNKQFHKFAEFRGMDLYTDGQMVSVVNPRNDHSSDYELTTFEKDGTLWLDRLAINIEDFTHYELGEAE